MNIVDLIKSQLTGDVLSKLSSLIGEGEDQTKSAVGAAVPGLLAALASMASTSSGAEKLINSLKQVDPGAQGGFGDILAGPRAPEVQEKGTSLINILLGAGALPAIISILGKLVGIDAAKAKGLLGYLMPLILGMIAKQFAGRALTPQGLSGFFTDQKSNISSALPQGFSLADIPGLGAGSVSAATRAVSTAVKEEGGMPAWLLPLVGIGLLGLLAWWFLGQTPEGPVAQNPPTGNVAPRPVPAVKPADTPATIAKAAPKIDLPDVAKMGTDLSGVYTTLTDLLASVKDAATAETSLTKLTELTPKIDGVKELWDKLPEAGRTTVAKVTTDHLAKLKELIEKVLALPGVSEKLKPVLDTVVAKLAALAVS